MRFALLSFVLSLTIVGVVSADAEYNVQITHKKGVFSVTMDFEVDAPKENVRALLTDFVHLSRVNPNITETEILPTSSNQSVRVRIRTEGCIIAQLCLDLQRVEDVSDDGTGGIVAIIVPELSDWKSGSIHWTFERRGDTTRVMYQGRMEPGFWIPPVVGTKLFKKKLHKEMTISAQNIRRLANSTRHDTEDF